MPTSVKSLWYNHSMRRVKLHTGFTLIELSLSMVFVGILSLAMMLIISNAVVSYRRGNTLGQVNSIGMDLVDDMRAAVQASSAKTLTNMCAVMYSKNVVDGGTEDENANYKKCIEKGAYDFVWAVKKAAVELNGEKIEDIPIYGVFCTGTYSYIWNSGYFELDGVTSIDEKSKTEGWALAELKYNGSENGTSIEIKNSEQDSNKPFRLLKVRDDERAVCVAAVGGKDNYPMKTNNSMVSNLIDISNINDGKLDEEPIYLLASEGASNLALYDLSVAKPAISTENNSIFYSASFILGTIDGGINIKSQNSACAAPNDYNSNFDYCAINKFSFAMRAVGE